jgi:hypothetical protein
MSTATIPSRHDVAAQLRRMPVLAPLPSMLGLLPPHQALQRVTFDSETGVHRGVRVPAAIAALIGGWACRLAEGLGGHVSGTLEPGAAKLPRTKTVPAIDIATMRARALATQHQLRTAVARHALAEPALRGLSGVSVHWQVLGDGAIAADGCLLLGAHEGDGLRNSDAARELTALLMRWVGKTGTELVPLLSTQGMSSLSVRWPLGGGRDDPRGEGDRSCAAPRHHGTSGISPAPLN